MRHYYRGGGNSSNEDEITDDFAAFGAANPVKKAAERDGDYEVWPDNWPAVQAFLACQTQWMVGGMDGTLIGLNYQSVEVVMRLYRCKSVETFDKIRTMEVELLNLSRDKRRKHGGAK